MRPNKVDVNQWKSYAEQLLGSEFFHGFMDHSQERSNSAEPRCNVYRSASEIIVLINLPYIRDISQVHLYVKDQELIIKGHISFDFEHMDVVQENIFSGEFKKVIALPDVVNTKKVNAQYRRGILKVQLFPKLRKEGTEIRIQDL